MEIFKKKLEILKQKKNWILKTKLNFENKIEFWKKIGKIEKKKLEILKISANVFAVN